MKKILLTIIAFACSASMSMAAMFAIDSDVADRGIGMSDGSGADPVGLKLLWAGEDEQGVGDDNFFYTKAEQAAVLVFQLPDLGGESISTANLDFDAYIAYPGGTFPKNVMLYGSRYDASSAVTLGDYAYSATTVGTLLQGDLINIASNVNLGWGSYETSATGDSAITTWLSDQYTAGASAGDYVFLTIAIDSESSNPVNIAMAEHITQSTPVLTITTAIPEPGTMALVLISLGGLLLFRRRS